MERIDLLPPNASPLERALSLATDPLWRLGVATDRVKGFKSHPDEALLPWLVWEFGLGELLPYLKDPRRALLEGILWQRLRGTPAALSIALSWVGVTATVEQEPPGVHFAEFQLDPGRIVADDEIAHFVALARLSAPARSHLSRIYHGWDLRRFVLDASRLGEALLSDHSGVFWRDGVTKLSFGRVRKFAQPPLAWALGSAHGTTRVITARLIDRYLLDFALLGDPGHTPNPEILHAHLYTVANLVGTPDPAGMRPERRFCKAMVVPGDSTALGDINACTPRFYWREEGSGIVLGGPQKLSDTPHRLIRVEVLERFARAYPGAALVSVPTVATSAQSVLTHSVRGRNDLVLGAWRLGDAAPSFDRGWLRREHRQGSSSGLANPIGWRPRLYHRAMVCLGQSRLGDINSRTSRRALWRVAPVPRLGTLRLGDAPEVEWRSITEAQLSTSTFDAAIPYAFGPSDACLARVLTGNVKVSAAQATAAAIEKVWSASATWCGQTWTGVYWPDAPWAAVRELIGARHTEE